MKETSDYEIFKKKECNRKIDNLNLKKIVESLKRRNMLDMRPILVDKNMYVIDGQHRLEAAKILNLSIFYTIKENGEDEDIILLNQFQKAWSLEDYFNYYEKKGNENYIKLKILSERYNINANSILIFFDITGGSGQSQFKKGNFKINSDQIEIFKEKMFLFESLIDLIDKKTLGNKRYLRAVTFYKSLHVLSLSEGFVFDVLIKKVEILINKFHPCTTVNQYLEMLKSIYNYRNNEPIV